MSVHSQNYSQQELFDFGLQFGTNVNIHRSVCFFGGENIRLGNNVRIDCFCILSAAKALMIGSHVHISAGVYLLGSEGIEIGDYCSLSTRVNLFTANDDYREGYLTNPTVPAHFRKVQSGPIRLSNHVIVGSGSILLPGIHLEEGAAVGALSLVKKNVGAHEIVAGVPAQKIGMRNGKVLEAIEKEHRASHD